MHASDFLPLKYDTFWAWSKAWHPHHSKKLIKPGVLWKSKHRSVVYPWKDRISILHVEYEARGTMENDLIIQPQGMTSHTGLLRLLCCRECVRISRIEAVYSALPIIIVKLYEVKRWSKEKERAPSVVENPLKTSPTWFEFDPALLEYFNCTT